MSATLHEQDELSLLDLAIVFAQRKKLLLGLPLVAAIAAAVVALLMPNIYTANARLLPPQNATSSANILLSQMSGFATGGLAPSIGLKNPSDLYVGILESRTIIESIVNRFQLQEVYETKTVEDARNGLLEASSIVARKDGIISIDVEDKDPKRAASIANAFIEELLTIMQTLAVTEASQRRLFFEQQLKVTKEGLAQAEVELKTTQERTGLIKIDEQGKAIIEAIAALKAQAAAKEVELGAMRSFATDNNPNYIRTQRELAGLREQLTRMERAQERKGDVFLSTANVPAAGLEYIRKAREVKYQESMFEMLSKQYELARIDEAKDASTIQVLDRAIPPEKKSKPKRTVIVLATAFVTFTIAVLIVLLQQALAKVRTSPHGRHKLETLRSSIRPR